MSYPPLAVKFLSFSPDSPAVMYTISITDFSSKETFLIQSRYSLLFELHKHLSDYRFPLPLFPPKKCCFNKEPSFLSQRQKALENYFNTLLKNANQQIVNDLRIFFLNLRSSCSLAPISSSPANQTNRKLTSEITFKSQYFKVVVETTIDKFVDMNQNLNAPDDDEINRKKEFIERNKNTYLMGNPKTLQSTFPKFNGEKCKNCLSEPELSKISEIKKCNECEELKNEDILSISEKKKQISLDNTLINMDITIKNIQNYFESIVLEGGFLERANF
jgi:PX domain